MKFSKRMKVAFLAGAACLALLAFSSCSSKNDSADPSNMAGDVLVTPTPVPTVEPTPMPTPTPTPEPFAATGAQGYISIADTNIDYQIMLGPDNEYYLDKDESGNHSVSGSIYIDYRNADPTRRRNIVIMGHNMKNHGMFADLHYFEKEDFFNEHMEFEIELFGQKLLCRVAYAGMINYEEYYFMKVDFKDDQEFLDFINTALTTQARFKDSSYVPSADDQLITLFTCVSHTIQDSDLNRWLVVARVVDVLGEAEHPTAGTV